MTIRIPRRTASAIGIPFWANRDYNGRRFNIVWSLVDEGALDKRCWRRLNQVGRFRLGTATRMPEKLHENVIGLAFVVPGCRSDPCLGPDR